MQNIVFTDVFHENNLIERPKPASDFLPDWYKEALPYINGKKFPYDEKKMITNSGVKRCMPVFDALTAGYIMTTPYDMLIKKEGDTQTIEFPAGNLVITAPIEQFQGHPDYKHESFGTRLNHPWAIKTPKGWSILVMQPAHRETPFSILPGIVDTDNYNYPFNTFFKIRDPNFSGIIPAGTPYCQIIPIKRDNWKSKLGTYKDKAKAKKDFDNLTIRYFDKYKKLWWKRKSYK
jgi:hypothetical protein